MMSKLWSALWCVWKWMLHFLTGQCEVYRICASNTPMHKKCASLVQSLMQSKLKLLRGVAEGLGTKVDVSTATDIIIKEKAIKDGQFRPRLSMCLSRVAGVRGLFFSVEQVRAEKYSQDNPTHEALLMKLWACLQPKIRLAGRITKQWQYIGFQGNNPATDFRGMGLLGLQCLLHFAECHEDRARSSLLHSRHPQYWYPFAVVGIDMTGEVYDWLKNGDLDSYIISTCTQWPPQVPSFMEIVCFIVFKFDTFWMSEKPEDIMAYPRVKETFLQHMKSDIKARQLVMTLAENTDPPLLSCL